MNKYFTQKTLKKNKTIKRSDDSISSDNDGENKRDVMKMYESRKSLLLMDDAGSDKSVKKETKKVRGYVSVQRNTADTEKEYNLDDDEVDPKFADPEGTVAKNRNLCKEILKEVNKVRKNPKAYVPSLKELREKTKKRDQDLKTALKESMDYLVTMTKKIDPMEWSDQLEKSARDHYVDMAKTGNTSHTGSDGSSYKDRIERYAKWGGFIYEAFQFKENKNPESEPGPVVQEWVGDVGAKKNNRKNLLLSDHKHFACVCGPHPDGGYVYIAMFAGQIKSLDF